MKIAIITDNTPDQVNGVVSTINNTITMLRTKHHAQVFLVHADLFKHFSIPTFELLLPEGRRFSAIGYEVMLGLNKLFSYFRRKLGYANYWSLSSYVKEKVKSAASYINSYEQVLVNYAKSREVDIIFCGHIHKNEIKYIDDILYCNCGGFVESMTLIVEKMMAK